MIDLNDAWGTILEQIITLPLIECLVQKPNVLILADPAGAYHDIPVADSSAMDGRVLRVGSSCVASSCRCAGRYTTHIVNIV